MTSEQVSAASVAGPQEGPRSKPETSPKQVFEAFQKGFQYYEKGISVLQKKAEKDPASLSKVEKRRLSDFEVCKQGGQKAGEDGKLISIETPAGTSHEGIPVEGMVKNLREQIQERRKVNISQLHGTALDKISEEISEMERILSVIESNSKPFRHARIEEGLTDPAFFDERTKAEASIISEDGLRKSENPSDSDRVKEDWYDAEQSLNRRRELILPKEKAVSEQEQIEEVLDQLSSLVDRKGQIGSALQPEPSTLTPEVAAPVSEGPATATPEPVTPKSTPLPESSSPAETTSPTVELSPRDHKPEFFIDNLYDQEHVAKIDDIRGGGKLSVEKKALENLVFTEKDGKQTVSDLLTQVAGPMRAGETEPTYRSRLVSEVARRLRFQGDNRGSNDPLFRELKTRGLLDEEGKSGRLLQAAEGMINLYLEDDNALMMEDYRRFREDGRFYLTAADEEAAGERRLSGSMSLFSEKGERKLMPDRDLFASAMVSEYMMDIPYETTPDGKTTTFREKVTELDGKRKAAKDQGNRGEFDVLTDEVTGLRQEFYSKLENVLVKRSRGKGVTESSYNPFDPKRNLFENQVYQQLGLLLNKQTTPDLLSALVDHYVEHNNYAKGKEALLAKLKNLYDLKEGELVVPNFLIYAQEGTDFMERKMIRKPELHKIEKYIRPKKFIKEGPYVDVRVPYEESAPSTVTPPEKKGDGETGKTPEAAPAVKPKDISPSTMADTIKIPTVKKDTSDSTKADTVRIPREEAPAEAVLATDVPVIVKETKPGIGKVIVDKAKQAWEKLKTADQNERAKNKARRQALVAKVKSLLPKGEADEVAADLEVVEAVEEGATAEGPSFKDKVGASWQSAKAKVGEATGKVSSTVKENWEKLKTADQNERAKNKARRQALVAKLQNLIRKPK